MASHIEKITKTVWVVDGREFPSEEDARTIPIIDKLYRALHSEARRQGGDIGNFVWLVDILDGVRDEVMAYYALGRRHREI